MKIEKNILIAFILNLLFSIFEFVGGTITGSVAIVSDAVHDIGDAVSIGASYFLERKSRKQPDEIYTYGYGRYSVMGSFITTAILIFGSLAVLYNAILRIFNPIPINYSGMILFAVVGALVNFAAAVFTKEGDSLNQRAVNLHMLEDVLGWIVVLVGAVVMKLTNIAVIDPIMSISVSVFILVNALKNLNEIENLFLEKVPAGISVDDVKAHMCEIDGVLDVHHIHIRSIDGYNNYATMHIVTDKDGHDIKEKVREELENFRIVHTTLELEAPDEHCHARECSTSCGDSVHCHHHH